MIEIFRIIKNIGKAKGMISLVVGSQTRGRYLSHGNNAGHKLLHIFIFRSQLAVGKNPNLDSSVCAFFYFFCKLGHGNMYGMGFT